jgi:hypothetical protein
MKTAVAFIIFKRPDTTEKVFEAIRQAKPPKLLVIADGPRADRPGEAENCEATRAIIERVDWECEVLTNYSDINLGCKKRVSSGLNWVFENVDKAIILEDDCLPDLSFFKFCEELLERYEHDSRIMTICGVNFQCGNKSKNKNYSYYYSIFHDCWGWATWRRAWRYYDGNMELWKKIKNEKILNHKLFDARSVKFWLKIFHKAYENQVNSWFYPWLFSCWVQSGFGIFPEKNLVSNIGFGMAGTHTIDQNHPYANLRLEKIDLPLIHPPFILPDKEADKYTQNTRFDPSRLLRFKRQLALLQKAKTRS